MLRLEDGFIRSRGLGAALALPASLIVDRQGLYFDARGPSGFEAIANDADFDAPLLRRAERLRRSIVARAVSKYNVGEPPGNLPAGPGLKILVPGQVEDDASIRFGSPVIRRNADLLKAVRARNPDALIVYKPHPDVEAGLRAGRVAADEALRYADHVARDAAIAPLLDWADRIEVMTSLAGFEALLRGKAVVTHGAPFFAGWGLTDDLLAFPRRTRRLDLDMLVAAALILYPRYVDPITRIPCPPEFVVERLGSPDRRIAASPVDAARAAAGLAVGRALRLIRSRRG